MKKTEKRIRWVRVGLWAAAGLVIGLLTQHLWVGLFVMLVFAGARLVGELSRPVEKPATPPITPDMAAHYAESGLSESEINLFRETMDQAADEIHEFEAIADRVPKIKTIAVNADLLDIMHAYFKAIVQTPKKLGAAGHFIYEQLPNVLSIAQKYEAITHHEVKTQDTYDVLTTAANTLRDLADTIKSGYSEFVESDIDDLEADIDLAKKQIKPRLAESTETVDRSVHLTPEHATITPKSEETGQQHE
ncbi:5-bromo-4-chloroindolyl phosphate hydrolysis family protein [Lacticaseibacillus hegangensis]|uniref:5-bromo-4-chloroindolyl phosphate hydrolysis family protein n=1 Tax=Lacticaseibacillus hegangensis TaxID=2486010 RepID=A0ABW4CWT2_9LACO|nr:5-bromo-4-chloroindolyl phosphate hydrolysis family protein [Lacticaseibacillus hegangensis]